MDTSASRAPSSANSAPIYEDHNTSVYSNIPLQMLHAYVTDVCQ